MLVLVVLVLAALGEQKKTTPTWHSRRLKFDSKFYKISVVKDGLRQVPSGEVRMEGGRRSRSKQNRNILSNQTSIEEKPTGPRRRSVRRFHQRLVAKSVQQGCPKY
jgi:hypothetical protein